jgi:hypothetical protein
LTGIFALLLWANLASVALFLGVAFAAQLEAVRASRERVALHERPPSRRPRGRNSGGSSTQALLTIQPITNARVAREVASTAEVDGTIAIFGGIGVSPRATTGPSTKVAVAVARGAH